MPPVSTIPPVPVSTIPPVPVSTIPPPPPPVSTIPPVPVPVEMPPVPISAGTPPPVSTIPPVPVSTGTLPPPPVPPVSGDTNNDPVLTCFTISTEIVLVTTLWPIGAFEFSAVKVYVWNNLLPSTGNFKFDGRTKDIAPSKGTVSNPGISRETFVVFEVCHLSVNTSPNDKTVGSGSNKSIVGGFAFISELRFWSLVTIVISKSLVTIWSSDLSFLFFAVSVYFTFASVSPGAK